MKIYALLSVKNEIDIIAYSLREASKWADKIFILDNGSTDGTWELIQSMANEKIIPWRQDNKVFYRGIRLEIFNEFRDIATESDWWCIMDTDEFYIDDPREFLNKISSRYSVICTNTIEYVITTQDVEQYSYSGNFEDDKEKIRYYKNIGWVETRFFRHRKNMSWPYPEKLPVHIGPQCPDRIKVKHYPLRSPDQIQVRLDTRNAAVKGGYEGWLHNRQTRWEEKIVNPKGYHYDKLDGEYVFDTEAVNLFPRSLRFKVVNSLKYILIRTGIWK